MPVPRSIIKQIKQIIPPLNGALHKGQSESACSEELWITLVHHSSQQYLHCDWEQIFRMSSARPQLLKLSSPTPQT
ncbi:uncharacterized protein F5891DRAFT_220476 [Suillus fuscotomentosus]|uniref:Uncharacterized protein n=1 Tax=Suillus fuscotomentosus TaxID=1912939 RepID=A0AAD4HTB4_9AGAM|nr:uncharacterized protein F5891DRAFT_220476 [Suillus fuscotomentosus]KAG1907932.1 hypothetical protein F5891DRAFT_220476 [Suillus fuscotomentosus]